ncbi:DAN domain family member 5-like [Astyanax mexicanus]|uniref:DAN domain BMP antagonist family member 5 n=1 Tax=Astyanax mexicanus TaxID=7994 RepID=A0A8B9JLK4_ASTMX|nr:DAN domain family member 5-like [Astyanax mexicanus]
MTTPFVLVVFLALLAAPARAFPRSFFSRDVESSGNGPEEPARGSLRLHKPSPFFLRQFPGSAGAQTRAGGARSRSPFPAFLALGRAGPSETSRRQQGLDMWRKNMKTAGQQDGERVALPINPRNLNLKDQSCAAVPFTQRISEPGCETLTIHNKLCFGHCTSLFVPPSGGPVGHVSAPCSRCAPSKARTVPVHLRCGAQTREKLVMMVEECKCETGREEARAEGKATHL